MPSQPSTPVDLAKAIALTGQAGRGAVEVLGALDAAPVLLIDLDIPNAGDEALRVPPTLPCVVIGYSRTAAQAAQASAVDVALTSVAAPAPWVTVDDLTAGVEHLLGRVEASPVASVIFVQVLRSGQRRSVDDSLILESAAYSALQSGGGHRHWLDSRPTGPLAGTNGEAVLMARDGTVLTVTLNHPAVHNAFGTALRDGLFEALSLAAGDRTLTEVHLRGAGPSFSSGGDLREFGLTTDPATAHLIRTTRSCGRLVAAIAGRVTAHLHGHCIGAGIELPAFARRVVAAPNTRIRLPELEFGLIPGAGGTFSIPRRVGRQRTGWLGLSGRLIDAGTAHDWGLVDAIEPGPT